MTPKGSKTWRCPKLGVPPNNPSHEWSFSIEIHGDLGILYVWETQRGIEWAYRQNPCKTPEAAETARVILDTVPTEEAKICWNGYGSKWQRQKGQLMT